MPQSFCNGAEALDFIQELNDARANWQILHSAHRAVARHGFETLLFFSLPSRGQGFHDVVLGRHWPEEWTHVYDDGGYIHDDPVIRHLRRAVQPFEWREVSFDAERYPRAAELMHLRAEFGFANAFVVPVPGVAGTVAGVSMSSPRTELHRHNKPAIHMMSIYAFEMLSGAREERQVKEEGRSDNGELTPREQEVLTWVAAGKTAWDIGELLAIAERTAHAHMQAATRKLGALNRTHAVALAMRDNLIAF